MRGSTYTRADLAHAIYREFGLSQTEAASFVDDVIEELQQGLAEDGIVKIPLFGSFTVRWKKARVGRNPRTMEEKIIEARKVVSFNISNALRCLINEKRVP